jgi:hypothetical protein
MKLLILIEVLLLPFLSFSQIDTSFIGQIKALDTANTLRSDTASVPNDLLSEKIRQLRKERKGLTVETVLRIKIMEEQQKDTIHSKEFYKNLLEELTTGNTASLIENSLINLYRRSFTEKEIDELTSFYKTSAGQKMDKEFILLMLQSLKDAEKLFKLAANNIQLNDKKRN